MFYMNIYTVLHSTNVTNKTLLLMLINADKADSTHRRLRHDQLPCVTQV